MLNWFIVLKVVMTTDGFVCAVSSSKPAGRYNDPRQMKDEGESLMEVCKMVFSLHPKLK